MFKRPHGDELALKLRDLFNDILENLLAEREHNFIIEIKDALDDVTYFNIWNNLNQFGGKRFWTTVDTILEMFDKKIIALKPVKKEDITKQEKALINKQEPAQQQQKEQHQKKFFFKQKPRWKIIKNQERQRKLQHHNAEINKGVREEYRSQDFDRFQQKY